MKNTHTRDWYTYIQRWTHSSYRKIHLTTHYMGKAAENQETQSHILAEPFINTER